MINFQTTDIEDWNTSRKSSKSIFVKKLDDEIPFHSNILEAGCGTDNFNRSVAIIEKFTQLIYLKAV